MRRRAGRPLGEPPNDDRPKAPEWQSMGAGPWSQRDLDAELKSGRPVDAYDIWAERNGFRGVDPEFEWLPLLVQLADDVPSPRSFVRLLAGEPQVLVPPLYLRMPRGLENFPFLTLAVRARSLKTVLAKFGSGIARYEIGLPYRLAADKPEPPLAPVFVDGSPVPRPVLIGIVDDGIPFGHERFRQPHPDGSDDPSTRFEYFWDQGASGPGAGKWNRFTYGREFLRADIESWMKQSVQGGVVDEERLYRLAGYDGVRRQVTHGAHMADCAAGASLQEAADPLAPRVAGVQLPYIDVADSSGYSLAPRAFDALLYLTECSDRLGEALKASGPCPLAIDLSYARHAGVHDGSSLFEKAVQSLVTSRRANGQPCTVMLPSGNHYAARGHARFKLHPGSRRRRDLRWRLQPDDRTSSFVEVWLPAGAQLKVSLKPPGGQEQFVVSGTGKVYVLGNAPLAALVYPLMAASGNGQIVLIAVAPTLAGRPNDPLEPSSPSGDWIIGFENLSSNTVPVHAWVERDGPVIGYPVYGRQSYFIDERYERYDHKGKPIERDQPGSLVRRAGSYNGFATGLAAPVLGAWVASTGKAAEYTGSSSTLPVPPKHTPTAAMVADESPVLKGVIAAKTRSNASVAMNGTSVAAAAATRWAAGEMKAAEAAHKTSGLTADREALRAAAEGADPGAHWSPRLGSGRMPFATPASRRRRPP